MASQQMSDRVEGMTTNHTLSHKTSLVVIVFLALAVSHTLEVFVKIFRLFRTYHGVYFYTLIAASVGIAIHAFGYFIRNYGISDSAPLEIALACGGGMLMITGQSIVLWSRLHLISSGKRDWWLLCMIIAACIIVQGGATALFAGSNSPNPKRWLQIYEKWEIFQVTWFVFQECLISGLYIYRTFALMRSSAAFRGPHAKRVFNHLIIVNTVVILLDVTILVLQYIGLYEIQTSWKTLAYAIKLKLEFEVLNQLIAFATRGFDAHAESHDISGSAALKDDTGDLTRDSRFGHSAHLRMDNDGTTALPMGNVMKKTDIQISVEPDTLSERSAKVLYGRDSGAMC
ncbi:uncharacterized protein J4E79_008224 [Alternaria viburni]|uniref:uncharacterized protein n=1 Tax=Alternaria viburni TaxID=566460 RepID=UPI0020C29037|nr:uncharacterized protein J4E79_008224 [Alternaria viburni]KAI4655159.1 hypothetical protein J4E79_008224 [Alternaria viburni]KAI4714768.1 hypothetical protein J4E89_000449 [Alternaria sp. Ai002NY15]